MKYDLEILDNTLRSGDIYYPISKIFKYLFESHLMTNIQKHFWERNSMN